MKKMYLIFVITLVLILVLGSFAFTSAKVVMKEYFVEGGKYGKISVREKYDDRYKFNEKNILLFVHGATYPFEAGFDLPIAGYSWMEYMAGHGFDVFALNIEGYGRSARPPEMDLSPTESKPLCKSDVAVHDINQVVNFILKMREVKKINILGWSWGTITTGKYTTENPDKVEKLILFGPLYSGTENPLGKLLASPDDPKEFNPKIPGYRTVDAESIKSRWMKEVKDDWLSKDVLDEFINQSLSSDVTSGDREPPSMRAPNGCYVDVFLSTSGQPVYDASKITCPVLIMRGDADRTTLDSDARCMWEALTNTPYKRYIIFADGTHHASLESKTHIQVYSETAAFLNE